MTLHIEISRLLTSVVSSREVMALLAEAVGNPTKGELEKLVATCRPAGYPALWIASFSNRPIGVMRLDSQDLSHCTITHIAVDTNLRGQGIGRKFIEFIRDDLGFRQAEAETDDDAIGFYQACGFEVESIQQNSYSIQRYKCTVRF